ncbi:MAG: TlpA family protein disulfide reductase [Gammaproteobacteria bacterium]|nr:TlpA family protein disulfide reductase [Gammaproteobacteria bacterium]MCY4356609.1 TlpA family protein disulfide reductase [Gammaproteobacteria bacterium]
MTRQAPALRSGLFTFVLVLTLVINPASHGDNFKPFTAESFAGIKQEFLDSEFLLGLWSVDCPPCLVELNMMGDLLKKYPDLPFVLISTDPIDERNTALTLLEDYELDQRESWMFADSFIERLRYSIDPGWYGELPRSYFFDSNHQRQSHSGIMTLDLLAKWFDKDFSLP